MKKIKVQTWASAIAGISLLLLPACTFYHIPQAQVGGCWVATTDSQRWIQPQQDKAKCEIALEPDGTFHATVPDYLLKTSGQCSGRIYAGKGRWSFISGLSEPKVQLHFTEVDGRPIDSTATPLNVLRRGKHLEMFFSISEGRGERFYFEKKPAGPDRTGL